MQNLITSKTNEKIKFLKNLSQKKYRDESGKFLVENLVTIYDALKGGVAPQTLFICEAILKEQDKKVKFILQEIPDHYVINEKINKSFSGLDTPSGICAVYKKLNKHLDFARSVVYLNGINDPGNLGTILRTALAFGIQNIILDSTCADVYNPKTLNAAKDAVFKLKMAEDIDLKLIKDLKKVMPIISTNVFKGKELSEYKAKAPFCLVFGSEAHGVSADIEKLADEMVTISMSEEMESLNVAVAAGIVLYKLSKI